ncbi:GntR family transcriptional regulator [Skermania sp. ID1734]|uniref:GntR family transcriptional regulator n=1 Tax=Skermania sp. ID1734 TaxID=2597516 RepID=UPI00117FEF1B|nr:GntR family transcriptional regulator [Skermania sp. ID1734]TSE00687.1 GntR family transcriptional regulator [Skermania sp. ID1734]
MAADRGKRTRGDVVYDSLRADILSGRRLPGERLKFSDLAEHCDASMSVIREALTRLAAEGLVTNEPNVGYAVTELSPDRLAELTDARLELESLVFARSITEGDLAWESRLVAAHHVLEGTPFLTTCDPVRVTDEWAEAHAGFHRALLAGCRNSRLFQMANGLRDEAELYRRWSQPLGSEKGRDLAGEHRRLMEAALARDVDCATAALRDHISHTTKLLLAVSEQLGF